MYFVIAMEVHPNPVHSKAHGVWDPDPDHGRIGWYTKKAINMSISAAILFVNKFTDLFELLKVQNY